MRLAILVAVTVLLIAMPMANAVQLNATLIDDTVIRNGADATKNYGGVQYDEIKSLPSDIHMPWYKFNVTPWKTQTISGASLCFALFGSPNTSVTGFQLRNSTNQTWLGGNCQGTTGACGGGITWNGQPVYDNSTQTTYLNGGSIKTYPETYSCFDVTSQINQYLSHGYDNATIVVFPYYTSYSNSINYRTSNSTAKPFLNISNGVCYAPYGTPPDYQAGAINGSTWDLETKGYCVDDFGNTSDTCNIGMYWVNKQTCLAGLVPYCQEYIEVCDGTDVCFDGKCVAGLTMNFTTNKEGCGVYFLNFTTYMGAKYSVNPWNGYNANFPSNTSVIMAYSLISDCDFDFWYLTNSSHKIQVFANSFNMTVFASMNVTAVWVGGSQVGGQPVTNPQGGGWVTGNPLIDPFVSGWFWLGLINVGIASVCAWYLKSAQIGLIVGIAFMLAFTYMGLYPAFFWIPIIIFSSIVIVNIVMKIRGGGGDG